MKCPALLVLDLLCRAAHYLISRGDSRKSCPLLLHALPWGNEPVLSTRPDGDPVQASVGSVYVR